MKTLSDQNNVSASLIFQKGQRTPKGFIQTRYYEAVEGFRQCRACRKTITDNKHCLRSHLKSCKGSQKKWFSQNQEEEEEKRFINPPSPPQLQHYQQNINMLNPELAHNNQTDLISSLFSNNPTGTKMQDSNIWNFLNRSPVNPSQLSQITTNTLLNQKVLSTFGYDKPQKDGVYACENNSQSEYGSVNYLEENLFTDLSHLISVSVQNQPPSQVPTIVNRILLNNMGNIYKELLVQSQFNISQCEKLKKEIQNLKTQLSNQTSSGSSDCAIPLLQNTTTREVRLLIDTTAKVAIASNKKKRLVNQKAKKRLAKQRVKKTFAFERDYSLEGQFSPKNESMFDDDEDAITQNW